MSYRARVLTLLWSFFAVVLVACGWLVFASVHFTDGDLHAGYGVEFPPQATGTGR